MAKKAETFNDVTVKGEFMASKNPAEINYLSKTIKNFNQSRWNEVSERFMREGVEAKFEQNEHLRHLLLSTGSTILAEASSRDKVWGIGLHMNDPKVFDSSCWQGRSE